MTGQGRPVLLVGSVNMPTRDDVFEAVAEHLTGGLRSVPDGETGDRGVWVSWELNRIGKLLQVNVVDEVTFTSPVIGEFSNPVLVPAEGVDLAEVTFGPFNYVREAVASYDHFTELRAAGRFSPETRFQVSIPTPMMFAMVFPEHQAEVLGVFERDLAAEVAALLAEIPADDLAVQWDVSGEIIMEEQVRYSAVPWGDTRNWSLEVATASIARVSGPIPEAVLLGVHLCYGDPEGTHMIEPRDLAVPVDFANNIATLTTRRLDWVHMPVPIERDDDAYFAPLAGLKLKPQTQLYLGLLHKEDGMDGAARRIAIAAKHVTDFGVATECGMGREPAEAIDGLLRLHRDAAAL
ncbi:hypothetical protein [Pseudonocardia alaniniphila]|uniref:Uncharacterized protein n=1 Tax=Pseudonocardia alaniniphila TaxID=75291 RepID=A0ABS9TQH8_9PSEU|nr:hypothetical protein [Pseudonocardia alaniniphila]MCH6170804.1 hypothetical protein [Pseudonocardia alaniniphila]